MESDTTAMTERVGLIVFDWSGFIIKISKDLVGVFEGGGVGDTDGVGDRVGIGVCDGYGVGGMLGLFSLILIFE